MILILTYFYFFFFFNDTATTEIYTLSLHDALPIWPLQTEGAGVQASGRENHLAHPQSPTSVQQEVVEEAGADHGVQSRAVRSEEHTSELQSRQYLVCRLLLEKKKNK